MYHTNRPEARPAPDADPPRTEGVESLDAVIVEMEKVIERYGRARVNSPGQEFAAGLVLTFCFSFVVWGIL